MKGSVTPVMGMMLSTPHIIISVWMAVIEVKPTQISLFILSLQKRLILMPIKVRSPNKSSMIIALIIPVSSLMAEKIKSVCTAGIKLGLPKNKPVPKRPPEATANND